MTENKAWTEFNLKMAQSLRGCNLNTVAEDLMGYLKESFEGESIWTEGVWMAPLYADIFTGMGYGMVKHNSARHGFYIRPEQFFVWSERAKEAYKQMKSEGILEELVNRR